VGTNGVREHRLVGEHYGVGEEILDRVFPALVWSGSGRREVEAMPMRSK
jgi:hypothetical protein